MKSIIILSFVIAACQAVNQPIELKCARDLQLDGNKIEKISRDSNSPLDSEYGDFYLCDWKARGIMDDKGVIVPEKIDTFIKEVYFYPKLAEERKQKILEDIKQKCGKIQEATQRATAMHLKNCIIGIINESKILSARYDDDDIPLPKSR